MPLTSLRKGAMTAGAGISDRWAMPSAFFGRRFGYHLALDAGDASLAQRALLMARARAHFRYPGVDDKGYLTMMGTDPIGVRNNDLPGHYAYLGRYSPDDFLMASQGASVIGDDLLGYFQQGVNDGQAYRNFSSSYDLGSTTEYDPYLPGRWATIKAMAQTNVKLPATSGQPDFAWADEENMVVAAKHGEERFYVNLFWRQPKFINGLAKVFQLTPTTARLADAMVDDVRFRPTGASITTTNTLDPFLNPPDNPMAAYGGLNFATAWRSDLSAIPSTNRDAGRGTGYTFRYGNWLVGINADYVTDYTVQTPTYFTSATDLISGSRVTGPVILKPKTSVVFYLSTGFDATPPPSRSLYLTAVGASGRVVLTWNDAGGANSYDVLRSTVSGTSYSPLQTVVTTNTFTDASASNGTTYYYVVTSVNATGKSGYSPEASATPK